MGRIRNYKGICIIRKKDELTVKDTHRSGCPRFMKRKDFIKEIITQMMECILHNLLTSCQYNQVFWIYESNDYDQNILIAKGTKQEMMSDEDMSFDLLDHINDIVEYWTIREDGAMFVRLRWDEKAEDCYRKEYVDRWDRNPHSRPYLHSAELDEFMHTIHGSSEYMHPYGDPNECHNYEENES